MNGILIVFWGALIFSSIAWYGFLVFYIGIKGGREIIEMIKTLQDQHRSGNDDASH